jgi:hypothetical protein
MNAPPMTSTATDDDALDGYVPPPYLPPATLDERLAKMWREVTRTPGRAALATFDLCAVAAFVISLRPIPVTTVDAAGPLRARCGIEFSVGGASNHAVDAACRYAFASRIPVLVLLALVIVGATALLVRTIAHPAPPEHGSGFRRLWQEVTSTPARAALATFDVAALLAVIAAAQPVHLATADATSPLQARCGLGFYVLGAANAAVRESCRRAYGPRASVFFIMLAALVVGVVVLARMIKRPVG